MSYGERLTGVCADDDGYVSKCAPGQSIAGIVGEEIAVDERIEDGIERGCLKYSLQRDRR